MPSTIPTLDTTGLISFASTNPPLVLPTGSATPLPPPLPRPPPRTVGADEDGEGEDELLPAMADDDYSAQLSWQSQSKDNLKWVLLSPDFLARIRPLD
jgi:transcription initiation factor TFIID subunit 11